MASDTAPMDLKEMGKRFVSYEKHIQTIGIALLVMALGFNARFMWSTNAQLAEIAVENKNLTIQIAKLEGVITAMQGNFVTRAEFAAYLDRVRALEAKKP